MKWYSANIVISFRNKDNLDVFPIQLWENIHLFRSMSKDECEEKAIRLGKATVDKLNRTKWSLSGSDQPVEMHFEGVRKIRAIDALDIEEQLQDGITVSEAQFEVNDVAALESLCNGEPILIQLCSSRGKE